MNLLAMVEKDMSFWDHLEELRWVLVRVAAVLFIFMIAFFFLIPYLFDNFIMAPTSSDFFLYRWLSKLSIDGGGQFFPNFSDSEYSVEIINLNVPSVFLTHISLSFYFSIVAIFPYLVFEIWRFVRPAMYASERRSVGFAFLFSTFMFFLGCAVGYAIVFPFSFRFLTEYNLGSLTTNQITLSSYMGIFMMLVFVMGIVFELPLLAWLLSKLGLVTKQFFRKYRRYAIVILLVLAAIITPTSDPFTLMVVFIPLYMLYELGIVFSRNAEEEEEEEDDEEEEEIDEIEEEIAD